MPPILLHPPKPRRVSRSFYRRWTWRKQVAASGTRLLVLAILALLVWGGWYLANKGFGRQWRTKVVAELRKSGIEASVRRLTIDPFRGLVAQDVRIYDFRNREIPLVLISEVALDINYAALLHHQPFLNAIDIRNANLTFRPQGGQPSPRHPQLQQFRAHIYFPPEQIHISQAEGFFCGIRISATGQLIKRADFKPTKELTEEELRRRLELLQRVTTELSRFNFPAGPPSLQINFSGDVAQMEDAHVEATLNGERIQRGSYEMKTFSAAAEWRNRKVSLTECEWTENAGSFSARGSWDSVTSAAEFQAKSSINAKQFLDAFDYGKTLEDATFTSSPQIELSGKANFSDTAPNLSVIGHLEVDDFIYKTVSILGLSTDFSWDGQRTMLRDAHVRHASGELLADILDAPGDFRLNVESSINPHTVRALAPPDLKKFLGEWELPRSPSARFTIRGRSRDPQSWTGDGTIALQRARFRGVWANSGTANLHLADGAITFSNLHVVRDEGVGTGSFTYDPIHHEVRLENVKTSLRPTDAIYWIEPKFFKVVAPYKFRGPPSLVANGLVQYRGGKNTRLTISVDAPGGMEYVFLGKTLPFEKVKGNLLITDERVQLSGLEAALFGGTVHGNADIRTGKEEQHHSARIAVEHIDFPRLTDLYFDYKTAHGQLTGTYGFEGWGDDTRRMHGSGKINVANGDVFAIPVFGPLSVLISTVIPGAGYSIARQATASFQVKDGVITTNDFKVSGKLFGLRGHGALYFLDDKLDFDVRVDAGGPGVLLTPVYSLFEYKGDGKLSKPRWHPKNF